MKKSPSTPVFAFGAPRPLRMVLTASPSRPAMDFAFEGLAAIATGLNVVSKSAEIVAVVRLSNRWRLMFVPVLSSANFGNST
jgi:hypothetical protein